MKTHLFVVSGDRSPKLQSQWLDNEPTTKKLVVVIVEQMSVYERESQKSGTVQTSSVALHGLYTANELAVFSSFQFNSFPMNTSF